VIGGANRVEELKDFLRAENDREMLRLLGNGDDVSQVPIPVKAHFVNEAKSRHGYANGTGR
jgi:hypothetical protein